MPEEWDEETRRSWPFRLGHLQSWVGQVIEDIDELLEIDEDEPVNTSDVKQIRRHLADALETSKFGESQ